MELEWHLDPSRRLSSFTSPGRDAPGLTARLTRILADYNVRILDIGQAVVHESLVLGILVEVPAGRESAHLRSTVKSALLNEAHALGLQAHFTTISEDRVKHWEHGLYHHHFIITVLGRTITAEQLARVSAIIAAHGMNIDRIDRLSGEPAPVDEQPMHAWNWLSAAIHRSEPPMRAEFLATAQELSIDIAFQRESIFRRNRRLFAFDMDSTLIQGEVIDELAKMAGVGDQVARITEAAMRGEIDFDESFTRRVALLKGLAAERVHSLLDTIPLADGAERLIRTLRLLGYKTAILSGGFTFFARIAAATARHRLRACERTRDVRRSCHRPRHSAHHQRSTAKPRCSLKSRQRRHLARAGGGGRRWSQRHSHAQPRRHGHRLPRQAVVRQKRDQSISCLGLDGLLYLLGVRDRDLRPHEPTIATS